MNELGIVVPAFNEVHSIRSVVEGIKRVVPAAQVFVIDDGSTDDTALVASSAGAVVIRLAFNCGVGAAMRTGLEFAVSRGIRQIVVLDGDGQHDPQEIPKLLEALKNCDVVVGTRADEHYEWNPVRKSAHRILSWSIYTLYGKKLKDVTSGYRAFSSDAAAALIPSVGHRYLEDTVLLLVQVIRLNLRIGEVSVTMSRRENGIPSLKGVSLALRYIILVIQLFIKRTFERRGKCEP